MVESEPNKVKLDINQFFILFTNSENSLQIF